MANFTELSTDLEIVSALSDLPNETDGLSSTQLKAKFDEAGLAIQTFLNDTLIAELQAKEASGKLGAIVGGIASNIQAFIDIVEAAGVGSLPPADSLTNVMMAADVKIGSLAALSTSTKTSIQAAMNEIVTNIGTLASLNTTTKTSIVAAINEILTSAGAMVPAGEVKYFAMSTAPTGYLKANGAAVSRTTYSALFAAIGTTYGSGDGSTTFNVPDLRGVFPRGWDDSRGYDAGRVFGSYQADDNKAHTHTGTTASNGAHTHDIGVNASWGGNYIAVAGTVNSPSVNIPTSSNGAHTHTFTTASTGATEVTVKNIALLACIKT